MEYDTALRVRIMHNVWYVLGTCHLQSIPCALLVYMRSCITTSQKGAHVFLKTTLPNVLQWAKQANTFHFLRTRQIKCHCYDSLFYYQLDEQFLYFNTCIRFLYMFRALLCRSSGVQIVLVQNLVSSLSLGDCSVHRLREDSRNLCTEQSPKESGDTRCCTNTICIPEDEDNSARNM